MELLLAWSRGEQAALDKLVPRVHAELRRLAHRYMAGECPGHTLQTTSSVNEVYLRLINARQVCWQNRAHFFAVSAQLMRRGRGAEGSADTVLRDWRLAKVWLAREMGKAAASEK
jgi:hypothetical protein